MTGLFCRYPEESIALSYSCQEEPRVYAQNPYATSRPLRLLRSVMGNAELASDSLGIAVDSKGNIQTGDVFKRRARTTIRSPELRTCVFRYGIDDVRRPCHALRPGGS